MMRKVLFVLTVTVVMMLALGTGVVYAYTYSIPGNVHGGYTATTAACAQCHNTHAAAGKSLIASIGTGNNDIYATCIYCHDGTGSKYDVKDGKVDGKFATSGGGFVNAVTTEDDPGTTGTNEVATTATASKHNANETTGVKQWIPGYAVAAASHFELTCASCHDPHNSAGVARALRLEILGTNNTATPPDIEVAGLLADEKVQYLGGINEFCAACHVDFKQGSGSGSSDLGTHSLKKRHAVGVDPTTYTGVATANLVVTTGTTYYQPVQDDAKLPLDASSKVVCLTCHYGHGTAKTNSVTFNRAVNSADPNIGDITATSNSSTILRQDNRGVCETCHAK